MKANILIIWKWRSLSQILGASKYASSAGLASLKGVMNGIVNSPSEIFIGKNRPGNAVVARFASQIYDFFAHLLLHKNGTI